VHLLVFADGEVSSNADLHALTAAYAFVRDPEGLFYVGV
jgi:hypothetical protein